eukprot:5049243-Pyramimonas_sp.AAC.1
MQSLGWVSDVVKRTRVRRLFLILTADQRGCSSHCSAALPWRPASKTGASVQDSERKRSSDFDATAQY